LVLVAFQKLAGDYVCWAWISVDAVTSANLTSYIYIIKALAKPKYLALKCLYGPWHHNVNSNIEGHGRILIWFKSSLFQKKKCS
jgi:hypothetical protein